MEVISESKVDQVLSNFHTAARAGVKKAAEAISAMSASAVRLDVISAGVSPTSRLSEIAGNPEDLVAGVYIAVTGDIPGHALLVVPYESALHLVDMVMGQSIGTTKRLDAMECSVIQEVGNIVTSSYLTALSDFYQCCMLPSPPSVAVDMAAAVIDSVLLNTGRFDDETISIVTRFAGPRRTVRGFFLYIPEIATSY
jgi:chemotaxis protein CheC